MRRIGLLFLPLLLSACAYSPHTDDVALQTITPTGASRLLIGQFDNAAQFASAPPEMKRAPAAGYPYDWMDAQYATFARVTAPEIGADVVYVEWRRADGTISRQRLWSFRTDAGGGVRMDYFSFRTPQAFADKSREANAFTALTAADLIGYGPACALYVDTRAPHGGWQGQIDAAQCQITGAASGRRMGLEVRLEVLPEEVRYQEAGILPDGAYAFKVPGGGAYIMARRTPMSRPVP